MKVYILNSGSSHGMANPLLESFRKNQKAFMTNSSCPPANLKVKKTQICQRFVQTIGLLWWLSMCLLIIWYFQPFSIQVCNPPEICKAHNQYPPHSTVHLENPPLLKIMINEQISSLT